jgi:hypothetical protein
MKKQNIVILVISIIIIFSCPIKISAQKIIIAFYNCENFYDTINQANVIDEDFLPSSDKKYTQELYTAKSRNIASIIYDLGNLDNANGIALMGLAEIENKNVLNQLINENLIKKYHYKFIHFDSKDPRGVDVALVYNPVFFRPYQYKPFSLTDEKHFTHTATRDILLVKGLLQNKWVYVLVNHWPSRRGSGLSSFKKREWASSVCKKIMDSLEQADPKTKIIVMGDFNDNPNNSSLKLLKMTNPFMKLFKRGLGSIAFNDSWNLFDQILLSPNWAIKSMSDSNDIDLNNYKPIIYKSATITEWNGKYRGYPKRTFDGTEFRGGYSDHFPVALIFTLKKAENPQ